MSYKKVVWSGGVGAIASLGSSNPKIPEKTAPKKKPGVTDHRGSKSSAPTSTAAPRRQVTVVVPAARGLLAGGLVTGLAPNSGPVAVVIPPPLMPVPPSGGTVPSSDGSLPPTATPVSTPAPAGPLPGTNITGSPGDGSTVSPLLPGMPDDSSTVTTADTGMSTGMKVGLAAAGLGLLYLMFGGNSND